MEIGYGEALGLAGRLHLHWIESPALAGNGMGNLARRPLAIYVPPGYDADGSRQYPVLYALHGYTGDAIGMLAARPWERNIVQRMDRLVREASMPPALLVLVDGWTRLGGSQYVDSVQNGNFATYTVRDVVGYVDAHYRTIAREGARAVLGKSSGGFGAIHLCLEHPGVFAAFASHSGDCYFNYAAPPGFPATQRALEAHDFVVAAFVEAFERKVKPHQGEFDAMVTLGYAAAYSPRSSEPFALDLPFDTSTGELREDVFARWLAFDPIVRAPERRAELERLRLRYLDCGRRDEYSLDIGARILARRIRELGLEVRHEEFDDGHRNVGYRYDVSLPALAAVLDKEP